MPLRPPLGTWAFFFPTLPPSNVFGRSRGHPLDPGKEGSALPALSRVGVGRLATQRLRGAAAAPISGRCGCG